MGKHYRLFLLMLIGSSAFCLAENPVGEGSCEPAQPQRAHVQLFYSGPVDVDTANLREKDYEWPSMNEDSFYDFFTK